MDQKFKLKLIEKLAATQATLEDLLKHSGSIVDIAETDSEIVNTAMELHDQIKSYITYLTRQDVIDELNRSAPATIVRSVSPHRRSPRI
jgi:hypothetical protein